MKKTENELSEYRHVFICSNCVTVYNQNPCRFEFYSLENDPPALDLKAQIMCPIGWAQGWMHVDTVKVGETNLQNSEPNTLKTSSIK